MDRESTKELLRRVARELDDTAPPNLYRMLARNPIVLEAFVDLETLLEAGLLTRQDRAVVALTVAVEVDCPYCQAALSIEADDAGVAPETIASLIKNTSGGDRTRCGALIAATRKIMASCGRLRRADIAAFNRRGLSFEELLEIVAIISCYTLATYANNLAQTRVDPQYQRKGSPSSDPD